jgi:PTH1 family peptidyl-tRNA hydrolase
MNLVGKKLIVGLGNPGKKYKGTRHNLGAMVVEGLGSRLALEFKRKITLESELAIGVVGGVTVYLLLPTTYMNLSGTAVRKTLAYYSLTVDDLIVVVDDVELPFGSVRYREKGSSGGHNGLKDIEKYLGQNFARLKIGIDSAKRREEVLESYVLHPFTVEERDLLGSVVEAGVEVLEGWLAEGTLEAVKRVERVNKTLALQKEKKARDYFDEER